MSAPLYMPVIERAYEETLGLLTEARDFIAERLAADDADLEPRQRLEMMAEQFRLTSRLSSVLAWLFFRKAVAAGEAKDTDLIAAVTRLDGDAYWRTERHQAKGPLPADLVDLLERSRRLYDRAARLDGMIRANGNAPPAAKPPKTRAPSPTAAGPTWGRPWGRPSATASGGAAPRPIPSRPLPSRRLSGAVPPTAAATLRVVARSRPGRGASDPPPFFPLRRRAPRLLRLLIAPPYCASLLRLLGAAVKVRPDRTRSSAG